MSQLAAPVNYSHPSPVSNGQSKPAEGSAPKQSTGRQRSACDACHQAKIRCSGGNPCMTCQSSQTRCTYSPGSRLGRPKGSKNKRTLLQENKNKRIGEEDSKKNVVRTESAHPTEVQEQQHIDPMCLDFDLDHGFDTGFTDPFLSPNSPNALLSPGLSSFLDSMSNTRMQQASPDNDLNNFFAQSTVYPSYQAPHGPDSEYTSGSVTSSGDDLLLSPISHSTIVPASNTALGETFPTFEAFHCTCLQQHVQLVFQLGDLQYSHTGSTGGPAVDRVLQGVQLAHTPWKSLMSCSRCQNQDNHNEVFLLFATSIRVLLSSVQKLNVTPENANTLLESNVGVSVGNFELTGETKAEVISIAIRRSLKHITSAMLHLWERAGRPRPHSNAAHSSTTHGNNKSGRSSNSSNNNNNNSNNNDKNNNNNTSSTNHNTNNNNGPFSMLSNIFAEPKIPSPRSPGAFGDIGGEDIGSLLNTLQSTMQSMKQGLGVCA